MISSIIVTCIRQFMRHQVFSLLNLAGLVIGISSALVLLTFVTGQITIDKYHPDNERTFIALRDVELQDGEKFTGETMPGPLADYVKSSFPEVESVCETGFSEYLLLEEGKQMLYATGSFTDSSYFSVFNLDLVAGNRTNPFPTDQSIVISTALSKKLFGEESAMGRAITVSKQASFTVTGVYSIPEKSSIEDDFLLPFKYHRQHEGSTWDDSNAMLYVKLHDTKTKADVEERMTNKLQEAWNTKKTAVMLFPLTDWYMHWDSFVLRRQQDRSTTMLLFVFVGAFILLMASVNFINLATARAATRAREIGVRKMTGATHRTLIKQFMLESLFITSVAAIISVILVRLLSPALSLLLDANISIAANLSTIALVISIILIVTVLAGGYPAFLLSSLKPATVLKGQLYTSLQGSGIRRALVVFQFSLSVMLIFGAITIRNQVKYLRTKDLGFDRNNVLYIEPGQDIDLDAETFREEALKNHNVEYVAESAASPMEINGIARIEWNHGQGAQSAEFVNCPIGYDYLPTLGFEMIAGRNFSPTIASDSTGVVVSKTAVEWMGLDDPIGKSFDFGDFEAHIIGVVNDFHNENIHSATTPAVFYLGSEETYGRWKRIFVRYKPGAQRETIEHLQAVTKKMVANFPFEFHFVDEDFEQQFREDARTESILVGFTVVALVIACLGLFGLTLFTTQRRTKEIGVRKVLGASVPQLTIMLCRFFFAPLIVALTIGLPLSYFVMDKFLATYQFHTDISVATFFITTIVIILLAIFTVSYQSIATARQNPAVALKAE